MTNRRQSVNREPANKELRGSDVSARSLGRYKVEAVSRAVLVLEALRRGPGAMTVTELADRTGLSVPAIEATLATLAPRGLIHNSAEASDRYGLGLGWLRLADVKRRQLEIREVALPVMRRMRDAVNETASLSIRIGSSRVNIEYAESNHEVRRIVQPGFHVALHVGAGGRALMSGLDEAEIESYLAPIGMSQLQKSKLVAAIKAAARDGYALVEGEVASDTSAISAPVRDHVGEVVAAVSLSMPQERLSAAMQSRCVKEVLKGARDISLALGLDPARA